MPFAGLFYLQWHFHMAWLTYTCTMLAHISLVTLLPEYHYIIQLISVWFKWTFPIQCTFRLSLIGQCSVDKLWPRAKWNKEAHLTDHGPEVVSHLLSVLKDGPEEKIPPRMFAALLQLRQVLLALEESTFCRLLLRMQRQNSEYFKQVTYLRKLRMVNAKCNVAMSYAINDGRYCTTNYCQRTSTGIWSDFNWLRIKQ